MAEEIDAEEQAALEEEAAKLAEDDEVEPEKFSMSPGCESNLNVQEKSLQLLIDIDKDHEDVD